MIASILGGVIAPISLRLVFLLALIPQTISVILSLFVVEPKHKGKTEDRSSHFKDGIRLLYKNLHLRKLSITEVLTQGVEESVFQLQLLFYNTLWPIWAVGLTRSIMSLGKFVSFRFSSKQINRFGSTTILFFNTAITRLIHFISILFPTLASPALMSSTSFLWGSVELSRNKLLQEQFRSNQRATMYSVLSFLGSLIAGVIGILVGLASGKFGIRNTLLALQLLFIPISYLYLNLHKTTKHTVLQSNAGYPKSEAKKSKLPALDQMRNHISISQ